MPFFLQIKNMLTHPFLYNVTNNIKNMLTGLKEKFFHHVFTLDTFLPPITYFPRKRNSIPLFPRQPPLFIITASLQSCKNFMESDIKQPEQSSILQIQGVKLQDVLCNIFVVGHLYFPTPGIFFFMSLSISRSILHEFQLDVLCVQCEFKWLKSIINNM